MPASLILRALNLDEEQILDIFKSIRYEKNKNGWLVSLEDLSLENSKVSYDIKTQGVKFL